MFGLFSTPLVSDFCHVKVLVTESPCHSRWVAFVWSELYQVSPRGAHQLLIVPNCGNGRRDWATVSPVGKPV